jgi:hypothetical protein
VSDPAAQAAGSTPAESPYQGLVPYGEDDADRFFGRDALAEIIAASLRARRLTVLYGPSGVGKSSVLMARVAHRLRERARTERAERGAARAVPIVFREWGKDPIAGLAAAVDGQAREFLPDGAEPPTTTTELGATLETWSRALGAKLLVILDQFEGYFLYREG